jgi:hypothetical protein
MKKLGALVLIWLTLFQSFGANYYVNATGGNDSRTTTQAQDPTTPWLTIGRARNSAVAGDKVFIFGGQNYAEQLVLTNSGNVSSRIIYAATNGTPTITRMWEFRGDYTECHGLKWDLGLVNTFGSDAIRFEDVQGCGLWRCTVQGMLRGGVQFFSSGGYTQSDRCWVFNSQIIGTWDADENAADSVLINPLGDDNYVGYNILRHPNQDVNSVLVGGRGVWEHNLIKEMNAVSPAHTDKLQTSGGATVITYLTNWTFRYDFMINTNGTDAHLINFEFPGAAADRNRFYGNVTADGGSGLYAMFGAYTNNYIFHETFYKAQQAQSTERKGIYVNSGNRNLRIYNCIFVETWGSGVSNPQVYLNEGSGMMHNGNLAYDLQGGSPTWSSPFTLQTNSVTADPRFVNPSTYTFTLQSDSPAIDVARALAAVTSSSGSGTTFAVTDAGFFVGDNANIEAFGGNLVKGMTITVGTDTVEVASVDYANNEITATTSFTWAQGDSVFFGSEAAPDIGALPRAATLLTAATINPQTGVVTPTGDAEMVALERGGVLISIDNTSPFTLSYQSGDAVYVFAKWAQETAVILATEESGGGSPVAAGITLGAGTISAGAGKISF